ncbi:MAG: ROK family protein, partial [Ferruginibacter sp.]
MILKPEYAIGIDIGGTNTVFGIVNHRGNIVYRGAISTADYETPDVFLDALYKALLPAIAESGGVHTIKGIGVGAPNANYYNGTIEYAPNLRWKGIIHLAKMVGEKFDLPAAITNDANAAAVGEMNYGAARG